MNEFSLISFGARYNLKIIMQISLIWIFSHDIFKETVNG